MKWISVKEQIYPQPSTDRESETFIAYGSTECSECDDFHYHKDLSIHEAFVTQRNSRNCDMAFYYVYSKTVKKGIKVLYWMPLPELPREK
jgi:hypothetical protein